MRNDDEELRELLALEAVGALSDTERAELDDAIEGRPELRAELESLRGAAATMAEAVSEPPPPSLRARVLETIATTPQEPALPSPEPTSVPEPPLAPVVPITAARRHRWVRWAAIAAAAAAVAIGVLVVSPFGDDDAGDHFAEVVEAPDARTIELTGELSGLRLVHSAAIGAAVLEGEACAVARRRSRSTSCGGSPVPSPEPVIREFRPDDGMVALVMEGLDPGDDVFAVTIEPAGGSDEPTSDPVAVTA